MTKTPSSGQVRYSLPDMAWYATYGREVTAFDKWMYYPLKEDLLAELDARGMAVDVDCRITAKGKETRH